MTMAIHIKLTFNWSAYTSAVTSITIMVGLGSMQADIVLEKELRVLHLYMLVTGSGLRHWV